MYTARKLTTEHVKGCLLGVAVGDALGMPYETMNAEAIIKLVGFDGVQNYPIAIKNGRKWNEKLEPGSTTDDWAMTLAVSRAIIRARGVPTRDVLIEEHIRAFDENPVGFGKSTREAIERYRAGDHKPLPFLTADEARFDQRSGNGVIMKIMPAVILGIKHQLEDMRLLILETGRLTHRDIRATALAYSVSRFACDNFTSTPKFPQEFFCDAYLTTLANATDVFIEEVDGLDEQTREWAKCDCRKSLMSATKGTHELTAGFSAMETAPLVINISSVSKSTKAGIQLAISRGGDTDTHASIVGGIMGLYAGMDSIPGAWVSGCKPSSQVIATAEQLCRALDIK